MKLRRCTFKGFSRVKISIGLTGDHCGCFEYGMKFIIDRFGKCWEEYGIVCSVVDYEDSFVRAQTHLFNFHLKYFEVLNVNGNRVYLFNRAY